MKTFQLIIVSFLLVAITTTFDVVVGDGTDIVYDGEGDQLKPGVKYYISFMTSDYNMWICRMKFGSTDPKACPRQPLMVTRPDPSAPTPVMFEPLNKTETVIRELSKLKVKFVNSSPCGESGYWRVPHEESEVVLNGSNLSSDTTFSITLTDQYYKFIYEKDQYRSNIGLNYKTYLIYKLVSSRYGGEMEVYFYKNMSTLS